jgi:hypothetical protein
MPTRHHFNSATRKRFGQLLEKVVEGSSKLDARRIVEALLHPKHTVA